MKEKPVKEEAVLQAAEQNKVNAVLALAGGGVIGVGIMLFAASHIPSWIQMPAVFCCCGLTILLMAALFFALSRARLGEKLPQVSERIWTAVSVVVFLSIAAAVAILRVSVDFGRLSGQGGYLGFWMATVLLFCLVLPGVMKEIYTGGMGKAMFLIVCAFACLIQFFFTYTPNLLNQVNYVIHHYTAVSQSIYNVAFSEPFTVESSGVYGHYAILLWPLIKLFGHGPQTITWFFVAGNWICLVLFVLLVCKVTRNYVLRSLAVIGTCCMVSDTYYGAYFPLRQIWPYLLLAYILYRQEISRFLKKTWLYYVLGYVFCTLAVTWNLDSGLAATMAFTLSLWVGYWQGHSPFSAGAIKLYFLSGLGCVCAVFGMVAIVNVYNLLCGGPLVFKDCFFPLIESDGYVESLSWSILETGYSWLIPLVCFACSICVGGLFTSSIFHAGFTGCLPLAFCGIMGLGESYYYFNRAVAGWACVITYLILCLAALSEGVRRAGRSSGLYRAVRTAVGMGSVLYLCVFAMCSVFRAPELFIAKIETDVNSIESMEAVAEEVAASVPKDTYTFGYCTQELYAYMGWDPIYHRRDVSDYLQKDFPGLKEEFCHQDMILLSSMNTGLVENDARFVKEAAFPQDDPLFVFYKNFDRLGGYEEVETPVDEGTITLTDMGTHQIMARQFFIKENTPYKIELTVSESTDLDAVEEMTVDFYGGSFYDEPGQEVNDFMLPGKRDYTFYFNSGTFGSESMRCQVRVFTHDMDSPVTIDHLRVTELRRADE